MEQLKKQFDMGVNVEFSHSTDPFAVASLLVLYLEELPGPLATYDLYVFSSAFLPPPHLYLPHFPNINIDIHNLLPVV